jgi:ankyrin repeat protein
MQMADCSYPQAVALLQQAQPLLKTPLTHSGQTLLMTASSIGSPHLLRVALQLGAPADQQDPTGRTAMHFAASVGNL